MSALLDTHAVLWYLEDSKELSAPARTTIEEAIADGRHVYVSAISVIEAVYLVERNKIPAAALQRLRDALTDARAGLYIAAVDAPVAEALERIPRSLVPDMPDRIIAATSLHLGALLVTRDRQLQSSGIPTIW